MMEYRIVITDKNEVGFEYKLMEDTEWKLDEIFLPQGIDRDLIPFNVLKRIEHNAFMGYVFVGVVCKCNYSVIL